MHGKEALRLAKKVGKGWFALLLAEELQHNTYFPKYILRAIAFSCHLSISESVMRQMVLYRLDADSDLAEKLRATANYNELSSKELIQQFRDEEPEDELTFFFNYIEEYSNK